MFGRFRIAPAGVDYQRRVAIDEVLVEAVVVGGEQHADGGGQGCGRQRHGGQVKVKLVYPEEGACWC